MLFLSKHNSDTLEFVCDIGSTNFYSISHHTFVYLSFKLFLFGIRGRLNSQVVFALDFEHMYTWTLWDVSSHLTQAKYQRFFTILIDLFYWFVFKIENVRNSAEVGQNYWSLFPNKTIFQSLLALKLWTFSFFFLTIIVESSVTSGQSYIGSTIVNYDSRVVIWGNFSQVHL